MRKIIFLSLGVAMLFMEWACNNNSSNPANSSNNNNNTSVSSNYFPLKVGNTWQYANYTLDSNGAKVSNTPVVEYDTIAGTTTIGGYSAYVMNSLTGSTHSVGYLTYDNNSTLISFIDTSSGQGRGYWMPLAAFGDSTAGTTVTFYPPFYYQGYNVTDTMSQTYEGIVSTTVQAGGPFSARYYSDTSHTSTVLAFIGKASASAANRAYYAAGIGRLKETSTIKVNLPGYNSNGGTYSELVKYSVH